MIPEQSIHRPLTVNVRDQNSGRLKVDTGIWTSFLFASVIDRMYPSGLPLRSGKILIVTASPAFSS